MTGLLGLGVDLSTFTGRFAAMGGGVGLIVLGRWLLRAQAVVSIIRMGGFFAILLGVLALAGVVQLDVGALGSVARSVADVLPFVLAGV
jgi:hypothetical protein